jgi:hypothetical protein
MGPMRYGDFPARCQLCWKERKRFGSLVDPNGHVWLICSKCIKKGWMKRQALREQDILNG